MLDDKVPDAWAALDDAERAVNEVAQTLEGVGVNLSLLWDAMQGGCSLDEADMRSLMWMIKEVVEACGERLDIASDLLEQVKK